MIDLTTFISRGFVLHPLPFFGKGRGNHKNQAVNLHKKERWTMQRKKTFLVVCVSILFLGGAWGQNVPSGSIPGGSGGLFDHSGRMANLDSLAGNDLLTAPRKPRPSFALPFVPISGNLPLPGSGIPQLFDPPSGPGIPAWNAGLSLHQTPTSPEKATFFSQQIPGNVPTLENGYYAHHLGFFCKKELEFEKTTRIPLRFRLGSLEQCNYLEGK